MKITFNLQNVGLGNNGGSATIVHSANMLHSLGHTICLVSEKDNMFEWFDLDGPTYVKTNGLVHDYPNADVVIATGAHSVQLVLNAPLGRGIKFWWIRAHETWAMGEKQLFSFYANEQINLLVNSQCLQTLVRDKARREVPIVRPGMDFHNFYMYSDRDYFPNECIRLGALYCDKPRKRFDWVTQIYKTCKTIGVPIELHLFGTYKEGLHTDDYTEYLYQPTVEELRNFYNSIDVWLAPTESEGLHMPPQEAMLCGCLVIGTNAKLSGMQEYLVQRKTGFIVSHWGQAVNVLKSLLNEKDVLKEVRTNAIAKIHSLGDRQENMRRFAKLLTKGKRSTDVSRNILALRRRGRVSANFAYR